MLKCNETNLVSVRLNGEIRADLVQFYKGCSASGTKTHGFLNVIPLCNERNTNHKLTVKIRYSKEEFEDVMTFDLDKIL